MCLASVLSLGDDFDLVSICKSAFDTIVKSQTIEEWQNNINVGLSVETKFQSNLDMLRKVFQKNPDDRNDADLDLGMEFCRGLKYFTKNDFSLSQKREMCRVLKLLGVWSHTTLFEEGMTGNHFYIIFSGTFASGVERHLMSGSTYLDKLKKQSNTILIIGEVEISVTEPDRNGEDSQLVVATLSSGHEFGDLALSDAGALRQATIITTRFTELLVLSRSDYHDHVLSNKRESQQKAIKLLQGHILFENMELSQLTEMSKTAVNHQDPYNSVLSSEGSRAKVIYIIVRGEVVLKRNFQDTKTRKITSVILKRCGPRSILGFPEYVLFYLSILMFNNNKIEQSKENPTMILSSIPFQLLLIRL